jgi:hypothetical protein
VGYSPDQVKTKTITLFCCFTAKHASLMSKIKDWLAKNQDNISEWSEIYTRRLLFH